MQEGRWNTSSSRYSVRTTWRDFSTAIAAGNRTAIASRREYRQGRLICQYQRKVCLKLWNCVMTDRREMRGADTPLCRIVCKRPVSGCLIIIAQQRVLTGKWANHKGCPYPGRRCRLGVRC
jgi:hypothetical protein